MKIFKEQYKLPVKLCTNMLFDAKSNHVLDIVCSFPYDKPLADFLLAKINGKQTDVKLTKSVIYKPCAIYTADGDLLINIRGWGRLKFYGNGEEIQDAIGKEIEELINSNVI